jgi:hypothetical protein
MNTLPTFYLSAFLTFLFSFLLMPTSMPHAGIEKNLEYIKILDNYFATMQLRIAIWNIIMNKISKNSNKAGFALSIVHQQSPLKAMFLLTFASLPLGLQNYFGFFPRLINVNATRPPASPMIMDSSGKPGMFEKEEQVW